MYSAALGSALGMLSLSLWFNFIVTRRLNQYTAGVMHVEMNLDAKWRKKRGVDDVLDAALLRDYFRKWFNTHCSFLADVSQLSFAFGVITLFFAASILTHMRFELKNEIHGAAAPFFIVITLASLGILIIEAQERRLGKQKRGVYAARPARPPPSLSRALRERGARSRCVVANSTVLCNSGPGSTSSSLHCRIKWACCTSSRRRPAVRWTPAWTRNRT